MGRLYPCRCAARFAAARTFILAVCCLAALPPGYAAGTPDAETRSAASSAPTGSQWSRVVAIGASATAGWIGPGATDGTNIALYRFSRYLDGALIAPHSPVQNLGNAFFFLAPTPIAKAQLDKALKAEPSMLVALDFLFWFCYGDIATEEERLERFESGLKLLEPVTCALVVGDIPDASAATNGMLRPAQVPALKTIAAANERLKQWASKRERTKVVGLSKFMEAAQRNEPIQLRERQVRETRSLLQKDKLHPTARGSAVLALAIADAASGTDGSGAKAVRWDLDGVLNAALVRD